MRVVHCRKEEYTHYCGRFPRWKARQHGENPLANMYAHVQSGVPGVTIVGTRDESIRCFEEDARSDETILAAIKALPADAVLGCWCRPKACHCDVIVELWKELHGLPCAASQRRLFRNE